MKNVQIGLRYPRHLIREEEVAVIAAIIKLKWPKEKPGGLTVTTIFARPDARPQVEIVLLVADHDMHDIADEGIKSAAEETLRQMPNRFSGVENGSIGAYLSLAA